jgi:MarR family transcriptional regulator, temperature-dependent positive regulator of motility
MVQCTQWNELTGWNSVPQALGSVQILSYNSASMSLDAKRSLTPKVRRDNVSIGEVYDEPGHLIRRAQQIAVSLFHSTMGNGVTPIQYCVLRVLQEHPGIDQVTLAKFCALDTSTAADLAVRLEERGLVRRMMPMKSKRFRLLQLTPEGAALVKKLIPRSTVLAGRLLQALNKEEQRIFMQLLKKFVHLNNDESRAPLDRGFAGSRNGNR